MRCHSKSNPDSHLTSAVQPSQYLSPYLPILEETVSQGLCHLPIHISIPVQQNPIDTIPIQDYPIPLKTCRDSVSLPPPPSQPPKAVTQLIWTDCMPMS